MRAIICSTLPTCSAGLAHCVLPTGEALLSAEPSDPIVHAEWYRPAQLIDDYTDLANAVARRARRLPITPMP
ncbi:hypothetical protein [Nocardia sp. NBC_00416]|uniref:hypothetical protein n=1 Tax=Nocardia sp. NBC_00416 TaxID=2975991 RepID=UPI002E1DA84A